MPDIVRDGEDSMMLWKDELCSTCEARQDCPLILSIRMLDLTTYGGCHVALCNRYAGTPTMTVDTEMEDAKDANYATLVQLLEKQLRELEAVAGTTMEGVGT